jgi:hypothetical protein
MTSRGAVARHDSFRPIGTQRSNLFGVRTTVSV